ncbi:conserved hypothetical protein [Leishmania major strain Friedlin]|uniref:Uncharacterized protein n=1 Tax=Leishmania major TaxID=5664 RepID=Q4QC59_LEIMA|nr:conserved hypothetical protein [Leishmania major strain Friedlin]CAG9573543.1 hypothetical_protein_-_conserved [Leishmania major strain Friedlin]CAJ04770.1 conserved hypothetical protein [Leishmania major strain Friedlin]|eukprot:XP_001683089.1 conserved hypothetical protein [Leishmania major strain Friedlin]
MLCTLIAAVLILVVAPPGAQAAASPSSFRCLRPFSASATFPNVAKAHPAQNCDYFYFSVEDAKAELKCASPSAVTTAVSDEMSCNVTVRVSMRRASDAVSHLQRQVGTDEDYFTHEASTVSTTTSPTRSGNTCPSAAPFVTEDEDVWRYAVSLKAKGDSSIHYKGFNGGNGYSLCCAALEEADCAWITPQKGDKDLDCDEDVDVGFASQRSRVLRGCPLPFPAPCSAGGGVFDAPAGARVLLTDLDEGESSGVFHAVITKPLHRIVEGPWEVMVQMWRRRQQMPRGGREDSFSVPADHSIEAEVLGRIMVPFTLNLTELQKQALITQIPSMALTAEDVAGVAQAAGENAADETGDL